MDENLELVGCFGEGSMQYADTLKEYIRDELSDSRYYSILSQKAPNKEASRIFKNMANDEYKHAKRFATAYFLITGKIYFPSYNELPLVIVPPYREALRERYFAQSKDAVKYPKFAAQTNDPCLKKLAINTGKDEEKHAENIYELIEDLN